MLVQSGCRRSLSIKFPTDCQVRHWRCPKKLSCVGKVRDEDGTAQQKEITKKPRIL